MKKYFFISALLPILTIILLYKYYYCIPDKLITPIVISMGFLITLFISFLSFKQWEKSRLESEILKEQLKLLLNFFEFISKNENRFMTLIHRENRNLISIPVNFSIVNYSFLEKFDSDMLICQEYNINTMEYQMFNEINNEFIDNPIFPKKLFNVLKKLDTKEFFYTFDYIKDYHMSKVTLIENEKVLLRMKDEMKKENFVEKNPLLTPYNSDKLRLKHIIKIYSEFNIELQIWFKKNNISLDLINIK